MLSPCHRRELELVTGRRQSWRCPACKGFALTPSVVIEGVGRETFNAIWQGLRTSRRAPRQCPSCVDNMRQVGIDELTLDGCPDCQMLWFDENEWADLVASTPQGTDVLLPLTEEESVAVIEEFRRRETARRSEAPKSRLLSNTTASFSLDAVAGLLRGILE